MDLKTFIRTSFFAFAVSLSAGALGYVFRLLLARNLDVQGYGTFYSYFAFFSFFIIFVDLGLAQSLAKHIIEYRLTENKKLIKQTVFSVFLIQSVFTLIMVSVFFSISIFTPWFDNYFKSPLLIGFYFLMAWFLLLPFDFILQSILVGFQKLKWASSISAIKMLILCSITAVVFMFSTKNFAPYLAYGLLNIFVIFFLFVFINRLFPEFWTYGFTINILEMKKIIKYAFFLLFAWFAWSIITQLDTLMIIYFRNPTEVAFYQVALPLAYVLTYLTNAVNSIAFPVLSEFHVLNQVDKITSAISLFYRYIFVIMIPLALVFLGFPDLIIGLLFGWNFVESIFALRILTIGIIFFSIASFNIHIFLSTNRVKHIAALTTTGCLINFILNLILVPKYGFNGASISTAICFVFLCGASTYLMRRSYKLKIPYFLWMKNLIAGLGAIFLLAILKKYIHLPMFLESFLVIFLAGLAYLVLIFVFKIVYMAELKQLVKLFVSRVKN